MIPKQMVGSIVKAIVSKDGLTSETQKIVSRIGLDPTTLSDITTDTTTVSGTGEPNGHIELKVGAVVIGSGTVGSDGKYSLMIPKQTVGSIVKAIVSKDGFTSEAQKIVSRIGLDPTTLSDITTDTTTVSGTGEPNGRIELKVESLVIGSGTVGSDGKYSLMIPKQTVGSIVKAIVSKDGLTSEAQKIVSRIGLDPTTLSDITTDTTTVSGTGEPNGRIELKVGSLVIGSGTVGSDGKYSLMIPKQTIGSIVKAIVSKDGLTSESQKTVIRGSLAAPTIQEYYTTDTSAKGKAVGGKKVTLYVNGKAVRTAAVNADGMYSIYTGDQVFLMTAGNTFQISTLDA
ncbi:Ig-like domain-containing protein, partial [Carnobacterium maltaromaticum]|uniref:Ig-like domain-containing protein n=1 Tax=Carnobacterium maltaromaticum TaxID=2751 RepID=UPI001F1B9C16